RGGDAGGPRSLACHTLVQGPVTRELTLDALLLHVQRGELGLLFRPQVLEDGLLLSQRVGSVLHGVGEVRVRPRHLVQVRHPVGEIGHRRGPEEDGHVSGEPLLVRHSGRSERRARSNRSDLRAAAICSSTAAMWLSVSAIWFCAWSICAAMPFSLFCPASRTERCAPACRCNLARRSRSPEIWCSRRAR